MSPPKVTILMPALNAEAFLPETLASIWAQTFVDFELLAIDDGSTDRTPEILAACRDPRGILAAAAAQFQHVSARRQAVKESIELVTVRLPELQHIMRRARLIECNRFGIDAHAAPDGSGCASASAAAAASRSRWARDFFSAAVFNCPQAASMSRPRGVRTGAEMPPSNTICENRRMRSGAEVS